MSPMQGPCGAQLHEKNVRRHEQNTTSWKDFLGVTEIFLASPKSNVPGITETTFFQCLGKAPSRMVLPRPWPEAGNTNWRLWVIVEDSESGPPGLTDQSTHERTRRTRF